MKWYYEKDIAYESIDIDKVKDNTYLLKTLLIASFIEITSPVYEKNLTEYYKNDNATIGWLQKSWEPEEVQHGKSLKQYINTVWPGFDWEKHYNIFTENYLPLCKVEALEATRAREMIARMVVETGTSTFYKTLANYAKYLNEPVLEDLTLKISKDEVYHFEMFEKVFKKYKDEENLARNDITKILYTRLKDINNEDIKIAFESIQSEQSYDEYIHQTKLFAKQYYPYKMAAKMFIRPLGLNKGMENTVIAIAAPAFRILGI
jgi:rubrerythrin